MTWPSPKEPVGSFEWKTGRCLKRNASPWPSIEIDGNEMSLDLLRFAAGALAGHRLRTVLSVAGVAVGISAVIALTALGEGARNYVTREFSALGTNILIVLPGQSRDHRRHALRRGHPRPDSGRLPAPP